MANTFESGKQSQSTKALETEKERLEESDSVDTPERILPHISIEEAAFEPGEEVFTTSKITAESGEVIGEVELGFDTKDGHPIAWIMDIFLYDEFIGMGYGKSTYLKLVNALKERGIQFYSGDSLSNDAHRMWEWLVSKGIAEVVEEGEYVRDDDQAHHWSTKYRTL